MSSRRSPASILAPLRRGSPPRPAVSSPAGRRAGALSFGLTLLGALGSGWCLISTGRALGALLRSSSAAGLLAQALAAAALSAVCQLLAQRVARFSAITEEASSVRSRQTENSTTVDVPESVSSGARCKRRRKRRRIRQKDTAAPVSPIGMSQHSELLRIPPNPQGDGYGCAGSGRDGTATKNITSSSRKRRRGKRKGKVNNACSTV